MTSPVIEASSLPETVCGKDERVQVQPNTSPPYNWICFLEIEDKRGSAWIGSGFKIHIPDVNHTAVVTSGHCTYIGGEYARKITVTFPGEATVEVGENDIWASPEYVANRNADHDYGLIMLPGNSDNGFGWSTTVSDDEMKDRIVTNCGYPGDKPQGTMWITGGKIERYTENRIFYMNDTMSGQSGSPVYTWYNGYWTVLGVHSYGGCPNSAPRFTRIMIRRFLVQMGNLKNYSIRSVHFPQVVLRCDGSNVTHPLESGGGIINCQHLPAGSYEKFHIYPVSMIPSLATDAKYQSVIESKEFSNVFIRMSADGFDAPADHGGGTVNCQYDASVYERFFINHESANHRSIQSVKFPHLHLRMDGTGVVPKDSGMGTVNCQWYASNATVKGFELFYIDEI